MRRIWIAVRALFIVLFNGAVAAQVDELLGRRHLPPAGPAGEAKPQAERPKPPAPKSAVRSEALTLLATLQREARFVDFIQESLGGYSDAQIGAVARDVHRDCHAVLQRLFALRPAAAVEEGATIEVPAGFDAVRYHLVGSVAGDPPFHGRVTHHGWEAGICQMPAWSGPADSVGVVAPVEVDVA